MPYSWVYSGPIVVYTHPFAVAYNWTCIDEQVLQFEINWPYVQWKLEVNVEEITGNYPGPGLTRNITVYDSVGIIWAYFEIDTPGVYSTIWIPPDSPLFTLVPGTFNISIQGIGWYYGGFHGQITVYARTQIHAFIYGESGG
ncbi:MAG: hypothetical protein Q6364_03445 [Candidatus Hermodarchaeota archaeon]|nr:hypothetical protein [Candidatus Hermodarchaeota archaeon]